MDHHWSHPLCGGRRPLQAQPPCAPGTADLQVRVMRRWQTHVCKLCLCIYILGVAHNVVMELCGSRARGDAEYDVSNTSQRCKSHVQQQVQACQRSLNAAPVRLLSANHTRRSLEWVIEDDVDLGRAATLLVQNDPSPHFSVCSLIDSFTHFATCPSHIQVS